MWCTVSRISLVKPEKARQVEDMILAQATGGRMAAKVYPALHDVLIDLIESIN